MPVEGATQRAIMLKDFGQTVSYTPSGGSASNVTASVDNEYEAVETGGSVAFAIERPRLTVRTADVSTAAEGDAVSFGGTNYIVRVVMNDGTGMTELMIEKQ